MSFFKPLRVNIYLAATLKLLALMIIYSLCRLGFYFYNYDSFNSVSSSRLLIIMVGGLRFDLVALLYLNIIFLLLQIIPIQFRYKKAYQLFCKWLFITINTLGIMVNLADFAYYKFTLKRTTMSVFTQFKNERNLFNLGLEFILDYWYLLLILTAIIWLLIKIYDFIEY